MLQAGSYVGWFNDLSRDDTPVAGSTGTALSVLYQQLQERAIPMPNGFVLTVDAYHAFLEANQLAAWLRQSLAALHRGKRNTRNAAHAIRKRILEARMPRDVRRALCSAYRALGAESQSRSVHIALRLSTTAADLPEADSLGLPFTCVRGEKHLVDACISCYAALFTEEAIRYREAHGLDHLKATAAVTVQRCFHGGRGSAGTLVTLDKETGFPHILILRATRVGSKSLAHSAGDEDEYQVFKPLLEDPSNAPIIEKRACSRVAARTRNAGGGENESVPRRPSGKHRFVLADQEILTLAGWGVSLEHYYNQPVEIAWAKDGHSGALFILAAQPEQHGTREQAGTLKHYQLVEKGRVIVEGQAAGTGIAAGKAYVLRSMGEAAKFATGGILVTAMTDPDWIPLMKRAAGIVTELGGRTSHAAIVSRELGVPAIIGTGNAARILKKGKDYTVSCAEGETGRVYEGRLRFDERILNPAAVPRTRTDVMMIIGNPDAAMRWWHLPVRGIGLARIEFIVNNLIKIHPLALVHFKKVTDKNARRRIEELTGGHKNKPEYFVDELVRGIARIAASQYPRPVIVRMSDFKTNEYADLVGGRQFEQDEENPMLGFRGASRYYSESYREAFALECRALLRVRNQIGLRNVIAMIPFCRTVEEADRVLETMAGHGLVRGEQGFQVYVMIEVPSNVILAEDFAQRFDGFSVGTNDLTQLILGVDRDSGTLRHLFNERNPAVKWMIQRLVTEAHRCGIKVGLCGQAPSDHPDFAGFLVEAGMDSISVNPECVLEVIERVAMREARLVAEHRP
jgi:pyruvate,water dikinase